MESTRVAVLLIIIIFYIVQIIYYNFISDIDKVTKYYINILSALFCIPLFLVIFIL
jgi:hypothetical protein